jgi:hypothetical protein
MQTPSVPNYLPQAILTTLFCCLPFGVIAVAYASQVNTHLITGNYQAAQYAADKAKFWSWVSFGVGISFWLLYILWIVVIFSAALSNAPPPSFPSP